jgi:putative protease
MVATIEQRGKFEINQQVEFFQPHGKTFQQKISVMYDEDGNEILAAPHAQQIVKIPICQPVEIWSLMR